MTHPKPGHVTWGACKLHPTLAVSARRAFSAANHGAATGPSAPPINSHYTRTVSKTPSPGRAACYDNRTAQQEDAGITFMLLGIATVLEEPGLCLSFPAPLPRAGFPQPMGQDPSLFYTVSLSPNNPSVQGGVQGPGTPCTMVTTLVAAVGYTAPCGQSIHSLA